MATQTIPLALPVEATRLANGLRVVVSPDSTAPVVTVGVYYRIGFRLEPPGRSGFAHLFEHMMFQGSEHAPKMLHVRLVNASGGVLNGSTNYDYTNYYQAVPSSALERVLWLEADRMRALQVTEENLINQREVVKEEVRVNVLNRPYGGFPWLDLPPVAFRRWPNAHNFYGDFSDLDAATLDDVRSFFETYYVPANAVLVIVGDVEPEYAFRSAERYFGEIPARPAPVLPDVSEPAPGEERRGRVPERFGRLPGLAVGYYLPPRWTPEWCALVLADVALHGGAAARLYRELVLDRQIALELEGGIQYPLGSPFDYDGPALMVTRLLCKPELAPEEVQAAYDRVIETFAAEGPSEDELAQVRTRLRADYLAGLEGGWGVPWFGRMHLLASFTLFDGRPEKINEVLEPLMAVSAGQVRAAAQKVLHPRNRAVVVREPEARP